MNRNLLLSFLFFISGALFFLFGILNGEIEIGIVLFFPFLVGSGIYTYAGFISIFIAVLLLMLNFNSRILSENLNHLNINKNQTHKRKSVKSGGIVLIGPIPIIFGSNWKIAVLMIILTLILIFVSLLIFLTI